MSVNRARIMEINFQKSELVLLLSVYLAAIKSPFAFIYWCNISRALRDIAYSSVYWYIFMQGIVAGFQEMDTCAFFQTKIDFHGLE